MEEQRKRRQKANGRGAQVFKITATFYSLGNINFVNDYMCAFLLHNICVKNNDYYNF